jgi:hypothetical protein
MLLKSSSLPIVFLLLAGCLSVGNEPKTTPSDGGELQTLAPPLYSFDATYNLTTIGSVEVADTYAHPGQVPYGPQSPPNPNCLVLDIQGTNVTHVAANASWRGGNRLVLFKILKDETGATHDRTHVIGNSTLTFEFDMPPSGGRWMFLGVEPAPDLPVGIGSEQNVTLQIEVAYSGDEPPHLIKPEGCSYSFA